MNAPAPILVTGGSGFIGTHLVGRLLAEGRPVVNLDLVPPPLPEQRAAWVQGDIKDAAATAAVLARHRPRHVVHLAAKATLEAKTLADFPDNLAGTSNVLAAVRAAGSVERLVVTSTQYVLKPGRVPASDVEFEPYTPYGASKVETERLTRAADLPCTWCITRPTNVWGPRHPGFPTGLWRFIAKGLYLHPGAAPIIKSYGYVANVVAWYLRLLDAPAERVHRRVFYLADGTMDSRRWMDAFAQGLTGKPARVIPRAAWAALAKVGDLAGRAGVGFPMTSDRLWRMTTPDVVSSQPTLDLLGPGPVGFEAAVAETLAWLRAQPAASKPTGPG